MFQNGCRMTLNGGGQAGGGALWNSHHQSLVSLHTEVFNDEQVSRACVCVCVQRRERKLEQLSQV